MRQPRIFSERELQRLSEYPDEVSDKELIRAFTLGEPDLRLLANRRRPWNRLGLGLQLCSLRHLGFVPQNLGTAPPAVVRFVADQIDAREGDLSRYSHREQQTNQVLCLNLVTNAIVTWNTVYMAAALESLRSEGRISERIDLSHLSPASSLTSTLTANTASNHGPNSRR